MLLNYVLCHIISKYFFSLSKTCSTSLQQLEDNRLARPRTLQRHFRIHNSSGSILKNNSFMPTSSAFSTLFFSYRVCFSCHSAIQLNGSANNIYNASTRMKQKNENSMKNLHCDPENYSIFECNYRNILVCFLKIVPCCYQILTIKLFVHILHKKMLAAG